MKNKLNLPELESKKVFAYFEELAAIPHGSRNTKQISDYLISFAKEHGLECYQDEANNVVIIQEASAGYESADPIIMQGHMDMVCEKEKGVEIDFEKDGLELYVDGDFLKAKGTTLGGDDGVAVAYILAIMDSPEIAHPRLEAVITVDEEIGMLGAEVIDLSMLKGHKMLNIDSDVEGHFLTSCAGGMTVDTVIPVTWQKQQGYGAGLTVTGLEGGHSGSEIDKEHANANILMGRVLKYLSDRMELAVVSLAGGLKDNAIPRECEAEIVIPEEKKAELSDYITELEKIEVAVRTQTAYILSSQWDGYWFTDAFHFNNSVRHAKILSKIDEEYQLSDEEFVKAFKSKYSDPFLPSWITMEMSSLDTLSILYNNLLPGRVKWSIAAYFGLPDTVFASWLHSIVYIRNIYIIWKLNLLVIFFLAKTTFLSCKPTL